MGSSSVNRRLVVAFCITLYCWFAFLDEKDGLDPEQVGFSCEICRSIDFYGLLFQLESYRGDLAEFVKQNEEELREVQAARRQQVHKTKLLAR